MGFGSVYTEDQVDTQRGGTSYVATKVCRYVGEKGKVHYA
jgi:hypothetical protein